MSIFVLLVFYCRLHFVFSLFVDNNCNKRRQTHGVGVGAEIQTGSNLEKSICPCGYLLGCVLANDAITYWYGKLMILSCLFISIICYTKIFLVLRRHQTKERGHGQQERRSQTISLNMARYKNAVSSALWLQFALAVCFLPSAVMSALYNNSRLPSSSFLPWQLAVTLVYLNSSLNPFLYCWKIPEVRQAVKATIRQMLCCSPN